MATYHVIGQPIPRADGAAKTTGHARYAADISLPGTLWDKSLHSPYAHARIVRIDTTAAQQVPGVHAVITCPPLPLTTRALRRAPWTCEIPPAPLSPPQRAVE